MGRSGRDRGPSRGAASTALALAAFAAVTVGGPSCTLLVEPDRQQCVVDADCRGAGGLPDSVCVDQVCQANPAWSCVGSVRWPSPEPGTVAVVLPISDLVTEQPVAGVSARVCRKLDVDCGKPITSDLRSDESGRLTALLPSGFDGYIELSANGYMPALYFLYPPAASNREVAFLPLLRPEVFRGFVYMSGKPVIEDRGAVMLGAYDCRGMPAEGISFGSPDGDELTTPFYLVSRIPSITVSATDGAGRGGIINVPARSVTITGRLGSDRMVSKVSLVVRPGHLTYTTLVPTPD